MSPDDRPNPLNRQATMNPFKYLVPLAACLITAAVWSASEAGSSASSATSAASNSVGASSGSIQNSSNSSSKKTTADAGDYQIIEVTTTTATTTTGGPAATARLTLQALNDSGNREDRNEFVLVLPSSVVEKNGLAAGATVTARQRPYGLEFAAGPARQAFFLVLADDWHRELQSTAVAL